jgi:PIN domain nuclease of toxin-antitoxin system
MLPGRLTQPVRRRLENPASDLYLSPVSIWEAQQLVRRKRLKLKVGFGEWLKDALASAQVQEAPFTFAVAEEAAQIELPHPDPGDLFLAATAVTFDLTLVTADRQLIDCSWLKTLANE